MKKFLFFISFIILILLQNSDLRSNTNNENILEADAVEINIKTKDTKIFMYENEKKVNIRSIN